MSRRDQLFRKALSERTAHKKDKIVLKGSHHFIQALSALNDKLDPRVTEKPIGSILKILGDNKYNPLWVERIGTKDGWEGQMPLSLLITFWAKNKNNEQLAKFFAERVEHLDASVWGQFTEKSVAPLIALVSKFVQSPDQYTFNLLCKIKADSSAWYLAIQAGEWKGESAFRMLMLAYTNNASSVEVMELVYRVGWEAPVANWIEGIASDNPKRKNHCSFQREVGNIQAVVVCDVSSLSRNVL